MRPPSRTPCSKYYCNKTSPTSSDKYEKIKRKNKKKLLVHRSPSITTFHKAESSKFCFNRAFWDNVISILQQHTGMMCLRYLLAALIIPHLLNLLSAQTEY